MHTGLEETPNGLERMAAFFAERARGGVGPHGAPYTRCRWLAIVIGGVKWNERFDGS